MCVLLLKAPYKINQTADVSQTKIMFSLFPSESHAKLVPALRGPKMHNTEDPMQAGLYAYFLRSLIHHQDQLLGLI